ncbi:MAG: hypothetical protein GY699_26955 [Desulfobacteraceae bacterium]|nr:hypothetical protein [Desulfobacteraceae bacterium]
MNLTKIQENIEELLKDIDKKRFIYELLGIYGLPKASITRLQKGSLNLSKNGVFQRV